MIRVNYYEQALAFIETDNAQLYGIASHFGRHLDSVRSEHWFICAVADLIREAGGL